MKSRKFRPRLTYANVIATLALFVALGGGAYAATSLPAGSVGTRQLRDDAITGAKVKEGSLPASAFAAGELPSGARGAPGPQGEPGEKGARGPEGKAGADGPAGPRGERGTVGPEGKPGTDGTSGPRGERGVPGPEGKPGVDGNAGPRGERGPSGLDGAAGEAGPRGERGPRGDRGPAGDPGPQGEPGPEGPQGEPGTVRTVIRYGQVATIDPRPFASYATCRRGESVTGGGYDVLRSREATYFVVRADRASNSETISEQELKERTEREELGQEGEVFGQDEVGDFFVYRDPKDGAVASGWVASLATIEKEPETRAQYRAYVVCATTTRVG